MVYIMDVVGQPLGDAADVQTNNFVYLDSTASYKDNDTITYVFTDAYVNGVKTDIRVDSTMYSMMNTIGADTLWYMGYTNGVGTSAQNITNAADTQAYDGANLWANATKVAAIGTDTLRDGAGAEWNVADTPVYGGEYAINDNVVIIYTKDSGAIDYDAVAVYVIGK